MMKSQLALFRVFWRDTKLRAPLLVIWAATLGGSLHAPVVPYFYLELKLQATDIGLLSTISSIGNVLLAPFYGWLLDTRGAYHAILFSSSMCAMGCLFRGLAQSYTELMLAATFLGLGGSNLITLVLAYLSSQTEPKLRALVISGYLTQLSVLQIGGKAVYPPFDALLMLVGFEQKLLRFRVTMSVCTLFCFFGVWQLRATGTHLRQAATHSTAEAEADVEVAAESGLEEQSSDAQGRKPLGLEMETQAAILTAEGESPQRTQSPGDSEAAALAAQRRRERRQYLASLVLVTVALWLRAACSALSLTLWPLWVKAHYGWDALLYSRLLTASTLLSTGMLASYSGLERTLGHATTTVLLCSAAAAGAVGFTLQSQGGETQWVHAALAVCMMGSLAALEPCFKALTSRHFSQAAQGRSFGAMATISGLGEVAAGILGTRLYQYSLDAPVDQHPLLHTSPFRGGALPFTLFVGLLFLTGSMLASVSARNEARWQRAATDPKPGGKWSPAESPRASRRERAHLLSGNPSGKAAACRTSTSPVSSAVASDADDSSSS